CSPRFRPGFLGDNLGHSADRRRPVSDELHSLRRIAPPLNGPYARSGEEQQANAANARPDQPRIAGLAGRQTALARARPQVLDGDGTAFSPPVPEIASCVLGALMDSAVEIAEFIPQPIVG